MSTPKKPAAKKKPVTKKPAAKKAAKKAPARRTPAAGITARVEMIGKSYEGNGKTVIEALDALKVPGLPRDKVLLTVTNGANSHTRVLHPIAATRLFSQSRVTREIALKAISQLFAV